MEIEGSFLCGVMLTRDINISLVSVPLIEDKSTYYIGIVNQMTNKNAF